MKFRLSVATQISIACALITVDALLLAHALGFVPDPRANRLQARETVTELVSRCAADSLAHDDVAPVQDLIRRIAERDPDVLSIDVRRVDGSLAASTPGHAELWSAARRLAQTLGKSAFQSSAMAHPAPRSRSVSGILRRAASWA